MKVFFESIAKRLAKAWRSPDHPPRGRTYHCQCGRPIFFRNSLCLGCGAALGYEPELADVRVLSPGPAKDKWVLSRESKSPVFRQCANLHSISGCNWLVPDEVDSPYCISCRLNRKIPDLNDEDNRRYWRAIEIAKRRLVTQLLAVELPVKSKVSEDSERGVMFDLLRSPKEGPRVMTSYGSGPITLNVEEAQDAR